MRHVLRVFVAVTIVLTVASPASAGSVRSALADQAYVERMVYSTPMAGFIAAVGNDSWFDWTTDFCSAPLVGNTGRTFNFTNSCRRHDFGYRNLQLLDQQFLLDMKRHCWSRPWYDEPTCLAWAQTFYAVVRIAGGP